MEFSYILTFLGGVIADLVRRILLPRSENWIIRLLPSGRREKNRERNIQLLDLRGKLQAQKLPADLIQNIEDGTQEFIARLRSSAQSEVDVFVEVQEEALSAQAKTQTEMNMLMFDRFEAAERLLGERMEQMRNADHISEAGLAALAEADEAFRKLRESDAILEGLIIAEGGSMAPMLRGYIMEQTTIGRIARLDYLHQFANGEI